MMKRFSQRLRWATLALTLLLSQPTVWAQNVESYQETADKIIAAATASERGYQRLAEMCTRFPHRLSGSQALERCIDWVLQEMGGDGFDSVTSEAVTVPHWERGEEKLTLLTEQPQQLAVMALGGSVSTPPEGLEAELLVVGSYDELEQNKGRAKGRIVVFNVPYTTYGQTGRYRWEGAIKAAEVGAVGALVRSVTPFSLATPHTGGMAYDDQIPKIPFGAITPEAAQTLARRQAAGQSDRVRLLLSTSIFPDAASRNVLAEIRGYEFPEQVVVMGGHIDGWDTGEGAHDDAGGVTACWEALRILRELGLKPRRTIRVVAWTNEENGLRGAKAYRQLHDAEIKDHVLALESDYGTFHPSGLSYSGNEEALAVLRQVVGLLGAVGPMEVTTPGGGADIGPLMAEGVPGAGLNHRDERYFWYHHSPADTLEKVDPKDFKNCVATLAVTAFVVADMPKRLPFGKAAEGSGAK
jgi:carboxypeptidase Q